MMLLSCCRRGFFGRSIVDDELDKLTFLISPAVQATDQHKRRRGILDS
jgi:hypothetical protein